MWNFIEDLGKQSLLPEFTDRFYVSLSVCDALNAKVCLALKDYTNAAIYADRVITKSNFALSTTSAEYANAFISNSNSKELILLWPINAARDCFSISLLMILTRHGIILLLPIAIVIFMPILQSKSRIFVPKQLFGADNSRIIKFPNGSTGQFVTNEQPSQTPIVVARGRNVSDD